MHIYLYRMLTISLGFCNNKVVFRGCDVCWRWIIYFRDFCTPYWAIAAVASYFWALCGTHLQHLFSSWAEGGVRLDTHHIQVCAPPEGRLCKCLRELSMDEAVTSQDRMIISLANVTFRFFFFQIKGFLIFSFWGWVISTGYCTSKKSLAVLVTVKLFSLSVLHLVNPRPGSCHCQRMYTTFSNPLFPSTPSDHETTPQMYCKGPEKEMKKDTALTFHWWLCFSSL